MTTDPITSLTDTEKEMFNAVRNPEYTNIMLLTVLLDGKQTACICAMNKEEDNEDMITLTPLFVVATPELQGKMTLDDGTPLGQDVE